MLLKYICLYLVTFTEEIFNPLTANVPHHIETSQLIYTANQLNSFCMKGYIGRS